MNLREVVALAERLDRMLVDGRRRSPRSWRVVAHTP
jgi:hypothetical protein